ncbi:MAG: type II toxin-antitoxin system VapC family toxin [Patescibacteria group bacterium]
MTSIFLDTNAYSHFIHGDQSVQVAINTAKIVYISSIVLGELYAGFINGSKFEINNLILKKLLNKKKIRVFDINSKTSFIYAELFVKLSKIGKPIPTNDIWIAASAIETNSTLVTYDKHFLNIPNLKLWSKISK